MEDFLSFLLTLRETNRKNIFLTALWEKLHGRRFPSGTTSDSVNRCLLAY